MTDYVYRTKTYKVAHDSVQPNGYYFAEDHGANVLGVFFVKRGCKKPEYVATATGPGREGFDRRVAWHVQHLAECANREALKLGRLAAVDKILST